MGNDKEAVPSSQTDGSSAGAVEPSSLGHGGKESPTFSLGPAASRHDWVKAKDVMATFQSGALILALLCSGFWTCGTYQRSLAEAQLAKAEAEAQEAKARLSKRGILYTTLAMSAMTLPNGHKVLSLEPEIRNDGVNDIDIDWSAITFTINRVTEAPAGFRWTALVSKNAADPGKQKSVSVRPGEPVRLQLLFPVTENGLYQGTIEFVSGGNVHTASAYIVIA